MLTAMLSCYLSENPADPKPRVHQSVFAAPFVSPHMHEGWLLNEWVLSSIECWFILLHVDSCSKLMAIVIVMWINACQSISWWRDVHEVVSCGFTACWSGMPPCPGQCKRELVSPSHTTWSWSSIKRRWPILTNSWDSWSTSWNYQGL